MESGLGKRLLPMALLFAASVPYAVQFSMNRYAAESGLPFLPYVFLYSAFGALILLAVCAGFRTWPRLSRSHVLLYLTIGAFGLAIPYCIFMVAAPRLPAGIVSIGLTLSPLLTYVWAMLLRMDRLSLIRIGGLIAGVAAVLLILIPEASLPEKGMGGWVLFVLLGPLSFSLASIGAALFQPAKTNPLEVATGTMVAGTLMLAPVVAAVGDWWFFPNGLDIGGMAVIVSALVNAYFFVMFQLIISVAGPVVFASNNFVTTLASVMWGMAIFHERHSGYVWGAIALMFVGLYLVTRPTMPLSIAKARARL